jgi:hypothetical protein
MTKTETFAQEHRLKVTRDECGDQIVQGRRGHLYFDGAKLCLMILDGPVRSSSALEAIGGKLWTGDKTEGVQDVKITGIPLENARAAIRMCRIKPKRIMSEAQKAAAMAGLDKARRIAQPPPGKRIRLA